MKIFDNRAQKTKYKVLREVAIQTWKSNDAFDVFNEIANKIAVKGEPPISCCIYKDRAIIADRIRIALGKYIGEKNTIQVVTIACDECPRSGHIVTDICRGCLAHNCVEACPKDAIIIDNKQRAHIDKNKCIECGRCAKACRYNAITNQKRPCESACKTNAITMNENGESYIIPEKCIVCGACVWECPFGALLDVSSMVDVIKSIMDKQEKEEIFAIIAPAVATQYPKATIGQITAGIKKLGFTQVREVAMGADIVAIEEAKELLEKGMLTSSCCPAFVEYININFPELRHLVSSNISPMTATGKLIKEKHPDAKVVFIGPCTAKKWEKQCQPASNYIDYVLTFEELQAMFDSKNIDLSTLDEEELNDASPYGRGFAISGGVSKAIAEALKELGHEEFEFKPVICNGLDECKKALTSAKFGKLDGNFIEGMACEGGCVMGNASLTSKEKPEFAVSKYCMSSKKESLR